MDLLFLEDSLRFETDAYRELLMLSRQEKDAIIKNDVRTLSSIVERQQKLLGSIKKTESERNGRFSGSQNEKPLIKDLIDGAPPERREALLTLAGELEGTAAELQRAGALNKMLIDTQMQYASFCLNLLTGKSGAPGTYSESGRVNEESEAHRRLVDRTV